MLEDVIRGRFGIQSLVLALRTILEIDIHDAPDGYSNELLAVLQAVCWLFKTPWIADIANRDNVVLLVDVLKYVSLAVLHTH